MPARLEDSRDSPQGPSGRGSTADITHARMLQLQELELAATITSILGNQGEPQGFLEPSKSEGAVYRLKSCLVTKDHSQKPGVAYNDTFAPVGNKVILKFVFLLLCIFYALPKGITEV